MPIAPLPDILAEALRGAVALAPQLKSDARWLWTDAYWPAKRDRDRPTRLHVRPDSGDPDHVPGPKLALGIGRDDVRDAWHQAARHVIDAHRLAGRALAHYDGRRPPLGPSRLRNADELELFIDNTVRRVRSLIDLGIAHGSDDAPRLDAHAAAVALGTAHAVLQKVLADRDGTGEPAADRRCVNCGDPCTPGRQRRECEKCARYRQRTGKVRQIRRHADAYDARTRRRERGEDYGENPLPGGRYVCGVWTASPHPTPQSRKEAS